MHIHEDHIGGGHEHSHDHHHHHHDHDHGHDHHHHHDHSCGGDCHGCGSQCEHTPMDELLALMKYLVSHNDAHAQEVADLARELLSNGKTVEYDEIMDAVSDFDMVNAKLAAILEKLNVEEF